MTRMYKLWRLESICIMQLIFSLNSIRPYRSSAVILTRHLHTTTLNWINVIIMHTRHEIVPVTYLFT